MNHVFGKQTDNRAIHAKGIVLEAHFTPDRQAATLSMAAHLQRSSVPVRVRFSSFAGMPTISDVDNLASPHGMSKPLIEGLDDSSILIGHSFGGLIREKLLGQGLGRAGIAIDPAQIKGGLALPLAQLRSALPALANPFNISRAVSLSREEFRYGFGNALTQQESDALHGQWTMPSTARPLFQAAAANFIVHSQAEVATDNATRGPLLLISGTADHTVPDVSTRATLHQYRHSHAVTELRQFEGRGHSLVIDHGWHDVAAACLDWLAGQGLLPGGTSAASSRHEHAPLGTA